MIVSLRLLGFEVLRLELASADDSDDDMAELISANRHAGEFGFGTSPARPYWSHDPEEAPAVAGGTSSV